MFKKTCLYLSLCAVVPSAFAGDIIQWTDTSVTGLYGDDYKLAPAAEQTTITLESAGGWTYGDWFWFEDFTQNHGATANKNTNYGEFSPRFSAGKILGADLAVGPITDWSAAFTYEHGEGKVESYLYGIGTDWQVPHFTYLQLNLYRRDADNNDSSGWQLTPVWRMDLPLGSSKIVFDGYVDWVFASDDDNGYQENVHFNPQIKYDLGQLLAGKSFENHLLVGIEYDYWSDKYGVKGVDQNTYSAIVKYHF
ncbi:outer membrane protein OmpK [Pseudaeromonas sp. ZJS20]|uniref:outer membrane protein OmpK n=1 Tax=Pseudaeromonas aegiceratis TaxID=3153928 RepID=UPI00390C84F8